MAVETVRQALMTLLGDIAGVRVPDPVPAQIDDKSIVVYPVPGDALPSAHRGSTPGSVVVSARDVFVIEYHRRIPGSQFGDFIGDLSTMTDTVRALLWGDFLPSGTKLGGAADILHAVGTRHLGELEWNETTFGVRLTVDLTHSTIIAP